MEQFSLEKYLENPKRQVVTRDGRKVTRFLCTDAKITFPLIALVEATPGSTKECLRTYTKDGNFFVDQISPNDLFFAPEKHEGWIIINKYPDGVRDTNGIIYHTKSDVPNITPVGVKRVATIKIEWEE